MTITRRKLLISAAVVLAAGPAAAVETTWGSPSGQPQENEPGLIGPRDYMPFVLESNQGFTARQVLVVTDAGAYGGALDRQVFVRDENKIGILRDIPLVGQLFSERLRGKDFDPAMRIGTALKLGDTLVVDLHRTKVTLQTKAASLSGAGRPTVSASLSEGEVIKSLVAANDTWSYHVNGTVLAPLDPAAPPAALAALAGGVEAELVGEAYAHPEGHLLVLVRPSILTGWS
jgi:hypothetical protein